MASTQTRNYARSLKAARICGLCGAQTLTPTTGLLTHFSSPMQSISDSPMSQIFNQSSTLAPLLMVFFIGNTADFGSFYNFKMTNWYRRSSLYDIGKTTTTCSFGAQSLCSLEEVTFGPWSWLSFKNGNPSSIFRLFANSIILAKAF